MLRHIKTYENLNSFKMKALNFLIICFIASSNIVSTSKGGQSFLGGKEDLPTLNKQRKLEEQYEGGYIKVYYTQCNYQFGFKKDIESRNSISKITISGSDKDVLNGRFQSDKEEEFAIYFKTPTKSLKFFFSKGKDSCCEFIKTIDFSHFDTSRLEDISYSIERCFSLESVIFNNSIKSNVESYVYMFDRCNKIKSIDLSGFTIKSSSVNYFIGMFKECDSLMFIDLSNFYLK